MSTEAEILELDEAQTRRASQVRYRIRPQELSPQAPRVRLARAFLNIGTGVDEKTAYRLTKEWWRTTGGSWTQGLS